MAPTTIIFFLCPMLKAEMLHCLFFVGCGIVKMWNIVVFNFIIIIYYHVGQSIREEEGIQYFVCRGFLKSFSGWTNCPVWEIWQCIKKNVFKLGHILIVNFFINHVNYVSSWRMLQDFFLYVDHAACSIFEVSGILWKKARFHSCPYEKCKRSKK